MQTTTRNATLGDLAEMLKDQHGRKLDMVVPASKVRSESGTLVVAGAEPVIDESGVWDADGRFVPTAQCDGQIGEKLSIPIAYLRRLRSERVDLYDANVNGWLQGYRTVEGVEPCENDPRYTAPDARSFLLRTFRSTDGGDGIARALLSDRFKVIDHLDGLTAALDAMRDTGVEMNVTSCDLTERRMYARVSAPSIAALAPDLLRGYRSPYRPEGQPNPVVFAGFELGNSETGDGKFLLTPRLVVEICNNGLKMTADAIGEVHLGGKLEEGVVRWTEDTQRKELELVAAKTRDAVSTFLDVDYVRGAIAKLEAKAGAPVHDAQATVQTVCKQLKFSEEHTTGVLDHFIRGGQLTAGGVMQAITSFSQTVADADTAAEMEAVAVDAMSLAAA